MKLSDFFQCSFWAILVLFTILVTSCAGDNHITVSESDCEYINEEKHRGRKKGPSPSPTSIPSPTASPVPVADATPEPTPETPSINEVCCELECWKVQE